MCLSNGGIDNRHKAGLDNFAGGRKKSKKPIILSVILGVVVIIGIAAGVMIWHSSNRASYRQAVVYMEQEKYQEAKTIFENLGEYQDAAQKAAECEVKQEKRWKQSAADVIANMQRSKLIYAEVANSVIDIWPHGMDRRDLLLRLVRDGNQMNLDLEKEEIDRGFHVVQTYPAGCEEQYQQCLRCYELFENCFKTVFEPGDNLTDYKNSVQSSMDELQIEFDKMDSMMKPEIDEAVRALNDQETASQ